MKRLDISFSLLSALFVMQSHSVFAMTEKAVDTTALKSEDSARLLDIPFDESPYPVILNRMPFGEPPAAVTMDPAAVTMDEAKLQAEQKKLADSFSWTAINITPEGKTAIGFTDLTPNKPPESYYITVGESANNWKLIQADYTSETATIEKDGIRISLKFGNKSPITPTATGAIPSSPAGGAPSLGLSRFSHLRTSLGHQLNTPSSSLEKAATPMGIGGNTALSSFSERLKERMKAQENLRQESDRKQKEELSKIVTDALRKEKEDAAAAAALQEPIVVPEGQPIEVIAQ